MALPALTKTWRFAVNQSIPAGASVAETHENMWLAIHKALQGRDRTGTAFAWTDSAGAPASAPAAVWAVESSSNTVTIGNNDQVDNINSIADVIHAGGLGNNSYAAYTHSVLGMTLVMGYRNQFSTDLNWEGIHASLAGVGAANGGADGTATTRPTGTDDISISSYNADAKIANDTENTWLGSSPISAHRLHTLMSSDGEITRIIAMRGGSSYFMLNIEKPSSPIVVDPNGTPKTWNGSEKPWVGFHASATLDGAANRITKFSNWVDAVGAKCGTHAAHLADSSLDTPITVGLSVERMSANPDTAVHRLVPGGSSDFDGLRTFAPVGVVSETVSYRGFMGLLTDIWMGNDTDQGVAEGDTYPNDLTRQFVALGNFILPWNGTVPLTT